MSTKSNTIYVPAIAIYAKLLNPASGYKNPKTGATGPAKYTINGALNAEGRAIAEKAGLRIKTEGPQVEKFAAILKDLGLDEQGYDGVHIESDRPVVNSKGEKAELVPIYSDNDVDENGKSIPLPNSKVFIGNGSKVVIGVLPKTQTGTAGDYKTYLSSVIIKELVKFESTAPQREKGTFSYKEEFAEDGTFDPSAE